MNVPATKAPAPAALQPTEKKVYLIPLLNAGDIIYLIQSMHF